MNQRARSAVHLSALTILLVSSLPGCYNTMGVPPPQPNAAGPSGIDRAVLISGEIVPLEEGEFVLTEEELVVREDQPSREVARVIPRSAIARFEDLELNVLKTVGAILLVPAGIVGGAIVYVALSL